MALVLIVYHMTLRIHWRVFINEGLSSFIDSGLGLRTEGEKLLIIKHDFGSLEFPDGRP